MLFPRQQPHDPTPTTKFTSLEEAQNALFQNAKTLTQVAALPFVEVATGIDVLLITSRRRGRWIIPKGWPVDGLSYPDAAAKEAREEAGAFGAIGQETIGDYIYQKRSDRGYGVACRVLVYPLRVSYQGLAWREQAERSLQWTALDSAADAIEQKGLANLLKHLARAPHALSCYDRPTTTNDLKAT
jgi:8-oxo-dGTP pyrophosphatase MutT (NUDIX family)